MKTDLAISGAVGVLLSAVIVSPTAAIAVGYVVLAIFLGVVGWLAIIFVHRGYVRIKDAWRAGWREGRKGTQ